MPGPDDFVAELPPDVVGRPFRAPNAPQPARSPRPEKPREQKPAEFKLADHERQRPHALSIAKTKRGNVHVISTEGVIGDLDDSGIDLLAGYIARLNGVGFTGSRCFRHRNPGGFGITLNSPLGVNPAHLLPTEGSKEHAAWMNPLYDDCRKAQSITDSEENRRAAIRAVTFPTWENGGEALLDYIRLIQRNKVPFFVRGPMTLIADVLLRFDAPCMTDTMHRWSELLPLLLRHQKNSSQESSATR